MSLGALLFDVDGTLADTEPEGHLPAYNRAFQDHGLDWHWTQKLYRKLLLVSGGRERLDHYLKAYAPELGAHGSRVRENRNEWIDELHRSKSRHFAARLQAGDVPLRAGVERLVGDAARTGLRIAIVTNASRATLEPFLAYALGDALRAHVELTVCGDEVAHKKPAPDVYLCACERLGIAPESCIAIEDSNAGVSAAHAARVPTLVTVNADTRDQVFDSAACVVDSLGEPDLPCRIIKSPGFEFDYVDVAVLERLHASGAASG